MSITNEINSENMGSYGLWLVWNESSSSKPTNVFLYEGYLDVVLLYHGVKYNYIHIKRITKSDIPIDNHPRANIAYFCLHDDQISHYTPDDKKKYMDQILFGRHANVTGKYYSKFDGHTYYKLEKHLTAQERRQLEIDQILRKLDPDDAKRLEELWKKEYDLEFTRRSYELKKNLSSTSEETE